MGSHPTILALHSLQDLTVDSCNMTFEDLARFLGRHPSIQRLHLGRHLHPPDSHSRVPQGALPRLTHLSASTEYLMPLLCSKETSPSLESVSVITRIRHGQRFDFGALNKTHPLICHRLQKADLALEVFLETTSVDWSPIIDADLGPLAILPFVTSINIRVGVYSLSPLILASLPKWLALFPNLSSLNIITLSSSNSNDLSAIYVFIRSLFSYCPRLAIFGMNNLVQTLSEWLLSKA